MNRLQLKLNDFGVFNPNSPFSKPHDFGSICALINQFWSKHVRKRKFEHPCRISYLPDSRRWSGNDDGHSRVAVSLDFVNQGSDRIPRSEATTHLATGVLLRECDATSKTVGPIFRIDLGRLKRSVSSPS